MVVSAGTSSGASCGPGGLTVEKPTGVINVIEGEAGSIARADVADFCDPRRDPREGLDAIDATPPHPKDAVHLERRRHVVGQGPVRGGPRGHVGHGLVIWVEAPSMKTLEARLRGRGTETEEKIQKDRGAR